MKSIKQLNLDTDADHCLLRAKEETEVPNVGIEDPKPENYCDSETCKI